MGLCALFTAAVRGIMRRETDELVSPPFNGWRDVQEQVADAENKKNKTECNTSILSITDVMLPFIMPIIPPADPLRWEQLRDIR